MSIPNPQIPQELSQVDDFTDYVQDFLADETTVTEIKCTSQQIEDKDFTKIDIRECVFENCSFRNCNFEKASFIDVIFESCDFSNSKLHSAYFLRCRFIGCKCVGVDMCETYIKQTTFEQSNFQYSYFDRTNITDVSFDNIDFTESSMAESKLKRFEATGCKFIKNNFFKTMLTSIDFTRNVFVMPIVSSPPAELKGAIVDMFQAADLIRIWGVIVRD